MKKLLAILSVVMALALGAQAQFVSGPSTGNMLTTSTAIAIAGSSTSNLAVTLVNPIPVGVYGLGLVATVGATNAASTTNAVIRFEATVDGTRWIDTLTPAFSVPQNGTAQYDVYTNILTTSANIGNLRAMRIASIQNTNLATIWFTNLTWSTR